MGVKPSVEAVYILRKGGREGEGGSLALILSTALHLYLCISIHMDPTPVSLHPDDCTHHRHSSAIFTHQCLLGVGV